MSAWDSAACRCLAASESGILFDRLRMHVADLSGIYNHDT